MLEISERDEALVYSYIDYCDVFGLSQSEEGLAEFIETKTSTDPKELWDWYTKD